MHIHDLLFCMRKLSVTEMSASAYSWLGTGVAIRHVVVQNNCINLISS